MLRTKLNVPRTDARLVERSRLTDRLNAGASRRLTIVSAPAGFGKTTTLAQWLAASPETAAHAAWYSLEPSDNDPRVFWSYVAAALQGAAPAADSDSFEPVVTALLNDIAALEHDTILILDDYHVIESDAIHAGVTFLVDHLPPRMHLVIATRVDPPLPLARLRARGELTELRVGDLRFDAGEASAFLNDVMALELDDDDVVRLEDRTEGWITALKLAALAGQGLGCDAGDKRDFKGGDGYVADYVIEEVLRAEPADVRHFLLATSMLDRLSGPLCDEVAGVQDAWRLLRELARRNLFLVALDEDDTWYRYHHLFAEILRRHAGRVDRELLRSSHRRASEWYERNGARPDAIDHALAAADHGRAADLLAGEWPEKNRSHRSLRWLQQARALPSATFAERPVLSMAYAWALLNNGEPDAAEVPLRHVQASLAQHSGLAAELAAARAYLAQMSGDAAATIDNAQRALALVPESDDAGRATSTALVALAMWGDGQLDAAFDTFTGALKHMRRAGRVHDAVRGSFVLGDLRAAQGRLREAAAIYESGLRAAAECDEQAAVEADELYLGLAEVQCEWGALEAAESYLQRLHDTRSGATQRGNPQRCAAVVARIRQARGDLQGALDVLEEKVRATVPSPLPQVRPPAAMRARLWIASGRRAEARAWADGAGLSADVVAYRREYELLTLARLLVAERALTDAAALLERVLDGAERGGRKGVVIEALMLLALTRSDRRGALQPLARALDLAEGEGFVRLFADEGTPMRELLREAIARGVSVTHAQRAIAAMDTAVAPLPAPGAALLTAREEVVLRLLATGLRNQEIAAHLFISPATAKRHIANIYLKLEVTHRTAALARAAELNLL